MRSAQDFRAFCHKRQALAGDSKGAGSILVISLDGKGLKMQTQDLRQ
jgi:hypothetical protein